MRARSIPAPMLVASASAASAVAAWLSAGDLEFLGRHLGSARYALAGACACAAIAWAAILVRRARTRGPWRTAPAHLRVLFVALVASLALQAFFVDRTHPSVWALLVASVLSAFAFAWAFGDRLVRPLPPRLVRGLDFAAWCIALIAVLGELALRATAEIAPSPLFAAEDLDTELRMRLFGYAPGQEHHGFAANSRGYFDTEFVPKRKDDPRSLVVCVGDSFSYGCVPHPLHFTTVCESLLAGAEVYNLGVAGAGPWDYLHWIETDVRALRPDLVVVDLFVGNDVDDARRRDPSERSPLQPNQHDLLMVLVPKRLARLGRAARRPELQASTLQGPPGTELTPLAELEKRDPWLLDPMLETPTWSEESFLEFETDRARLACGSESRAYELLFDALERMRDAARSTPFAVMLIPDEFQVEDELWRAIVARSPGVELDRDRPQRLVTQWLDERRIPYVDLLPAMRAVPPLADGRRHCYLRQDSHFNVRGNRVAGEALAALVRRTPAKR